MRVVQIGADEDARLWDGYVLPRTSTVTDLAAWRRVVTSAYGLRSFFLVAIEADRIVGALGLYEARHPLFGAYLATAPFGNDGGFHFDREPARDALLGAARKLAAELGVDYLLIRTRESEFAGFTVDRHYQTAVLDLRGGAEEVWKNRLSAKTRNQVRRGMKEGFTVATGHTERDAFIDVFHAHMRDLGSPAPGPRFYSAVLAELGERADFFVVRDGGELVAGALLFWVNGTAMNYHTVALRKFNPRCPNYLIYWKMIERSCELGCHAFDMGRSEAESSNLRFKSHWGPELQTLRYNYDLRKPKSVPYLDPRNPRYRLPILLWRRLPLFLTRRIGPRLMPGLL